MKIQLNQKEIEQAVRMFVGAQGINVSGKDIEVSFTNGRGEAGLTADLEIIDKPTPVFLGEAKTVQPCKTAGSVGCGEGKEKERSPIHLVSDASGQAHEDVKPVTETQKEETAPVVEEEQQPVDPEEAEQASSDEQEEEDTKSLFN